MNECSDPRFLGLMKRVRGIYVPTMEVSTARERLVTNPLRKIGFDDNFKRFIWPMTAVETRDIPAECLAVYKLLAPAPCSVLLEALEAIDEESDLAELNIWQYLSALVEVSTKQASEYLTSKNAPLSFIRGIDGMVRMVRGAMFGGDGLFFSANLPEELTEERLPGEYLLSHAPPQLEMLPFLSSLLYVPPHQMREAPSVLVT